MHQYKTVEGNAYYYWCNDEQQFNHHFKRIVDFPKCILLLDVQLSALHDRQGFFTTLKFRAKEFLKQSHQRSMITITTSQMAFGTVKGEINRNDDRILAIGGVWEFVGSTMNKDCQSVVEESALHWQKLYGTPQFTLEDFFDEMAKFNQHACHNWQNETVGNLQKYKEKGRWDSNWEMPIQLAYLIRLLDYDPKVFVELFELKNDRGYFKNECAICECLKVMGTNDPNTTSYSVMGVLFICWAAYRGAFPKGEHNEAFIQAIKSCSADAARHGTISPPQTVKTQKATAIALYEMIRVLCVSSKKLAQERDLIKSVQICECSLKIRISINARSLHQSIQKEYKKRIGQSSIGGGTSAKKIVNYFELSNICDRLVWNKYSILGTACKGFSIQTAGEKETNGIILKFGYERLKNPSSDCC
ncbi:MAG: hypothetical protein AAF985_05910 [Bacteroidota bacterium]